MKRKKSVMSVFLGVKTWKFPSNFPNRKHFWNMKGMNIASEKIPGYMHWACAEQDFYDIKKAQHG